jgi:hypothetical protein
MSDLYVERYRVAIEAVADAVEEIISERNRTQVDARLAREKLKQPTVEYIKAALLLLSDAERAEAASGFCRYCGALDCRGDCENDE